MKGDIANTPLSQINTMAGSDRSLDSQIADIADNNIVNSSGQELSDFYKSVITCIKTLSNDLTLSVGVGEDVSDGNYDVTLPLIADEKNQSLVALIRGLGDSFAMMRLHHDPVLHQSLAPEDPVADRLFTLLERERFEEVGSRQFKGVARNLEHLWTLGHNADTLSRFGAAEQLELVLSCLCKESLSGRKLPVVAARFIKSIREPIEQLVGAAIQELGDQFEDQSRYAEHSLLIIKLLGFDTSPMSRLDESAPPGAVNSEAAEKDQEENEKNQQASDELTEEQTPETEQSSTIEENAELTPKAELVRNFDSSTEKMEEDTEEEADNTNEDTIVETDAIELSLSEPAERYVPSYTVFDAQDDEICKAQNLADTQKLRSLRKELDLHVRNYEPLIGQLAARLQKKLLSRQQRSWQQDLDEGELDPQRLTRIILNPLSPLTYRVATEEPVRDTAVCLLIDNSRSMLGKPIATAATSADLITRVLERCGVSTEVLGFTTVSMYGGKLGDTWKALGSPTAAGRLNSVRHIIYKSAASSLRRSRDNFGLMLDRDILKQNIDGEALMWAEQRLQQRPEKRKILIVISDGKPSDSYTAKANHKDYLSDHLNHIIDLIERRAKTELIAIGIGHQVSHHYKRSFNINDVEQLGPLMLTELSRLLTR